MADHITASPLCWPEGWKRIKVKTRSRFGSKRSEGHGFNQITIDKAVEFVLDELCRMGVKRNTVVVSTDLKLRQDGLPYSSQRIPNDVGASVWWKDGNKQQVIALDKYDRIADNIYAIGKTIEAMRGIERWGSGEILERSFSGFTALPGPDHVIARSWRDVLNYYGHDLAECETEYMRARMASHPDRGGSDHAFNEVQRAWEAAQSEL